MGCHITNGTTKNGNAKITKFKPWNGHFWTKLLKFFQYNVLHYTIHYIYRSTIVYTIQCHTVHVQTLQFFCIQLTLILITYLVSYLCKRFPFSCFDILVNNSPLLARSLFICSNFSWPEQLLYNWWDWHFNRWQHKCTYTHTYTHTHTHTICFH